MDVGRNFFMEGAMLDVSRGGGQNDFLSGVIKVVKFHFTNSESKIKISSTEKLITKYQIPKSWGRLWYPFRGV